MYNKKNNKIIRNIYKIIKIIFSENRLKYINFHQKYKQNILKI